MCNQKLFYRFFQLQCHNHLDFLVSHLVNNQQNKLSFESEKLVVDYISFNIPGSNNTESIAKYLFEKFNFNSTFAKGQNGTTDDWFYLPVNQHQVSFRRLEYDP